MAKIRVLYVEAADQPARVLEIDNHSYEQQSKLVKGPYDTHGYLESVPLPTGHTLWCNEEGLLDGLPLNRVVECGLGEGRVSLAEAMTGIPLMQRYPNRIHGPFFITGDVNPHGYSKGLAPKDIETLKAHLKIEVQEGAA